MPLDPNDRAKLMTFPRYVLIGRDVIHQTGDLLERLGYGRKALIVCDGRTRTLAAETAKKNLLDHGFAAECVVVEGASMDSVRAVQAAARKQNVNLLIGAGGGSVIDVAKLSAYELHLPYVSMPTSAAHDGIASGRASIKENQGNVSKTAEAPEAIIADTAVILQAPYRMLASGCGDMMANLVAVKDWQLAHEKKGEEFSTFAASLSLNSAELIIENAKAIGPHSERAVWLVVKSLIASGVAMSIAGDSRPASGSEHMFSHMLDRLVPGRAMHGEQCGVGAILMMHRHGGDWERIRETLQTVKAPVDAKGLGIDAKTIVQALSSCHTIRPDRYTILGETGLGREEAERVARAARVI